MPKLGMEPIRREALVNATIAEVGAAGSLDVTVWPRQRLNALIEASFADSCFDPGVISAWLNFYVQAQQSEDAMRLLRVYQRRLRSNLIFALRPMVREPGTLADAIAALIDDPDLRAPFAPRGLPDLLIWQDALCWPRSTARVRGTPDH